MKISRVYTGPDGQSHFGEMDIPMKEVGGEERRSALIQANGIVLREMTGDFSLGWHKVPGRRLVVTIDGCSEITVGDGTRRQFSRGDMLLLEDTTGQGHMSRAVGNQPRISIVVTLE